MVKYNWIEVSLSEFYNNILKENIKNYCVIPNGDTYYYCNDQKEEVYYKSVFRKGSRDLVISLNSFQVEEFMILLKTLLRKEKIEHLKERIGK
jgi:hypothetical protein